MRRSSNPIQDCRIANRFAPWRFRSQKYHWNTHTQKQRERERERGDGGLGSWRRNLSNWQRQSACRVRAIRAPVARGRCAYSLLCGRGFSVQSMIEAYDVRTRQIHDTTRHTSTAPQPCENRDALNTGSFDINIAFDGTSRLTAFSLLLPPLYTPCSDPATHAPWFLPNYLLT